MKRVLLFLFTLMCGVSLITSCSKDDDGPDDGGNKGDNNYGQLGNNLITIGSARDVTYTTCVLLGTVDFPKITSDHTYGIVYLEAVDATDFDYDTKLIDGGHSDKTDKIQYSCISVQITNSAADGKFEKQLINLKPATVYYYRAYVRIGQNVNYSKIETLTTKDPMPEITMTTLDASDIYAVKGTMNGGVNVGNLMDVNENQKYGFIYSSAPQLNTAEKLTYEYYEKWMQNHFETDDEIEKPNEVITQTNMNGKITSVVKDLTIGTTYYYRTFFSWNGKYFYSPEVKTLTTLGLNEITVGTNRPDDVTYNSATLSATIPFSKIGYDDVDCGFVISKVYSNGSELKADGAPSWDERDYYPNADVYEILTTTEGKDFKVNITGLEAQTTYYVCAYIVLDEQVSVDGEDKDLYIYGPVQSFTTEKVPDDLNNIEITSTGLYPWTENGSGVWTSGNKGIGNSSSVLQLTVTHQAGETLVFNYSVSSEANYDKLSIGNGYNSRVFFGEESGEFSWPFSTSGTTTIAITYSKDGSGNNGKDEATISNIRLEKQ